MSLNRNLLCLKWEDFDSFLVAGLAGLYQKEEMADTTLFCEGRSFRAHKLVLAIWSPYFREIFATTTQVSPVIVLRETLAADLELIIKFMYQGQLFIPYEDTDRFLKAAEHFQIAGLRNMRGQLSSSPSPLLPSTSSSAPNTTTTTSVLLDGIPVHILPHHQATTASPPAPPHHHIPLTPNKLFKPIPNRQQPQYPSSGGGGRAEGLLYHTSPRQPPILLLPHNSGHGGEEKGAEDRRAEGREGDHLMMFERTTHQPPPPLTTTDKKLLQSYASEGHCGGSGEVVSRNRPSQQDLQEESLGSTFTQESSSSSRSSSHSHVIQGAVPLRAGVVGVEDVLEMESSTKEPITSEEPGLCRGAVSFLSSSPIYAVKRVPNGQENIVERVEPEPTPLNSRSTDNKARTSHPKRPKKASSSAPNAVVDLVSCPKCDKKVKKTSLKVHIKRTHLEEGTILVCPICTKQINSKGVYYKHMYGHRQRAADKDRKAPQVPAPSSHGSSSSSSSSNRT